MRIGDLNQDNYKLYLNLLGVRNTKALDKFLDRDERTIKKDYSFEARAKRMVELGYAEEGMMIREGVLELSILERAGTYIFDCQYYFS